MTFWYYAGLVQQPRSYQARVFTFSPVCDHLHRENLCLKTDRKPLSLGNTVERRKLLGPVFHLTWIGRTVGICCSLRSLWFGFWCHLTSGYSGVTTGSRDEVLTKRVTGGGFSSTMLVVLHHYHYDQHKTVSSATNVCVLCNKYKPQLFSSITESDLFISTPSCVSGINKSHAWERNNLSTECYGRCSLSAVTIPYTAMKKLVS